MIVIERENTNKGTLPLKSKTKEKESDRLRKKQQCIQGESSGDR